jgi:hypothetical protein
VQASKRRSICEIGGGCTIPIHCGYCGCWSCARNLCGWWRLLTTGWRTHWVCSECCWRATGPGVSPHTWAWIWRWWLIFIFNRDPYFWTPPSTSRAGGCTRRDRGRNGKTGIWDERRKIRELVNEVAHTRRLIRLPSESGVVIFSMAGIANAVDLRFCGWPNSGMKEIQHNSRQILTSYHIFLAPSHTRLPNEVRSIREPVEEYSNVFLDPRTHHKWEEADDVHLEPEGWWGQTMDRPSHCRSCESNSAGDILGEGI